MDDDGEDREDGPVLWGVDLRDALGHSALYAMIVAFFLFTNRALQTGFGGDRLLAVGYFVPVLVLIFALNVAARAVGLVDAVAERVESPVSVGVAISVAVGLAVLLS